ncbi:MAG: serine/threonine-protein phosphatase [Blautia sp.]|nr:serine/threonine-protein phosphatase [Blautia sp.]
MIRGKECGKMHFTIAADTDVGTTKDTNQDSILVKHGKCLGGELLMAIVCDGMGGLSKGELASATVVRSFSKWFDEELPYELEDPDLRVIGGKWSFMLKDLNLSILEHAQKENITMGTTFTGILFIGDRYMIAHVGDTRVYHIGKGMEQLTKDQTYINREISRGNMTPEQAKTDKRRNMLLQCVGASDLLEPEIMIGESEKGAYMLCTDGFRHEITDTEMYESLNPVNFYNKEAMHSNARYLIDLVKQRKEKDNISVILIKTE